MNVTDLIRAYERAKSVHQPLSPSLNEKLRALQRVFGKLSALTSGTILADHAARHWPHAQPGTVKRMLVQLRAVFTFAEQSGILHKAPLIPVPYVYDTRSVEMTLAERTMLLDHIKLTERWAYPSLLLLIHCGGRLNEAMRIDPAKDFTPLGVRITKLAHRRTKTVERTIPYTRRLLSEINGGAFSSGSFIRKDGMRFSSEKVASASLGKVLKNSCKALSIPPVRNNDLRHVFAGIIAEMGGDLGDIAAMLGHTNTTMALRYRGLVRSKAQKMLSTVLA